MATATEGTVKEEDAVLTTAGDVATREVAIEG